MRKFQIILIICLTISSAFGKSYENKNYRFPVDSLPVLVALAPVNHELGVAIDTFYSQLYTDSGLTNIIQPMEIRAMLAADSVLFDKFKRVAEHKYSKEEIKAGPSIYAILDTNAVLALKISLANARLLLFPISFEVNNAVIATSGKVNFRLYDLASGELIYEKDQQLLVEQGGDEGKLSLSAGLIAFSRDHYRKYFLDKLKK
jgi:hypothetical protein